MLQMNAIITSTLVVIISYFYLYISPLKPLTLNVSVPFKRVTGVICFNPVLLRRIYCLPTCSSSSSVDMMELLSRCYVPISRPLPTPGKRMHPWLLTDMNPELHKAFCLWFVSYLD